jgi:hypothetical protein
MDVDLICRVALGFVFAAAVVGKLRNRADFAQSLSGLGISRAATPTAVAVIAAEALCVVLLLFAMTADLGYALALLLLAAFSAGIVSAVRTRRAVACNCFGSGGKQLGPAHLVRNGLLALIAVVGLLASQLPISAPSLLIALGAGAFLSLLFIRWDDLTYLFGAAQSPS